MGESSGGGDITCYHRELRGEHDGSEWSSDDHFPYPPEPSKWRWDPQAHKWRPPWYVVCLDLLEPLIAILVVGGMVASMLWVLLVVNH